MVAWLVLLLSSPALATDELLVLDIQDEPLTATPPGWELTTHVGTPDIAIVREEVGPALKLHADKSSFSLQKKLDVDLVRTPWLVWQWKVTAFPDRGDFSQLHLDDQAAQLILAFSKGFWDSRHTISYIWGSAAPIGATGNDAAATLIPFLDVKVMVVRSGREDFGKWMTESRNVLEDYKLLYGKEPERVVGIRIQINSQHTEAQAESLWSRIAFRSHP